MRFDIVTLFPDFFSSPLSSGLLGKALAKQIASVHLIDPRNFATDKHRRVDDEPYGGGVGMLMKPEPIFGAVESLPVLARRETILMTPQGEPMKQPLFRELAANYDQLVIICGHYEGVDERVLNLVTREVSLGDFVLTCGEIPALALLNGTIRLLPGTVGKEESLKAESFEAGLLDYPQYTRPADFRGWKVPDVLLSGNHAEIERWRRDRQIERTRDRRPDLFAAWLQDSSSNQKPKTMNQNELENDIVTISQLQIALTAQAGTIQSKLSELSLTANTQTQEGLMQLLQASVQALLENSECWTHVLGSSQTVSSREEAETVFNKLSLQERSKFTAETLSNVDGKVTQQQVELDPDGEQPAYIVVTLLIGTADDQPLFENLNSAHTVKLALEKVTAISLDYLMVFELLWSPQVETDALTQEELLSEYRDLVEIA
ncbi:tRNA (guanosine(37)-N1)-methyltransferase TrmD [Coleofasciculus sp. FACHB-64]|nr:tRNA (guanosine(37)-N1)-methyltransferase TrmD [Coleofasciculus sp. FACHB-501]MBD2045828.1 tRNA (guanosine(37)-N1)-methyltransferase TrmD [Coleofasciculus sp. FACHB-64]